MRRPCPRLLAFFGRREKNLVVGTGWPGLSTVRSPETDPVSVLGIAGFKPAAWVEPQVGDSSARSARYCADTRLRRYTARLVSACWASREIGLPSRVIAVPDSDLAVSTTQTSLCLISTAKVATPLSG